MILHSFIETSQCNDISSNSVRFSSFVFKSKSVRSHRVVYSSKNLRRAGIGAFCRARNVMWESFIHARRCFAQQKPARTDEKSDYIHWFCFHFFDKIIHAIQIDMLVIRLRFKARLLVVCNCYEFDSASSFMMTIPMRWKFIFVLKTEESSDGTQDDHSSASTWSTCLPVAHEYSPISNLSATMKFCCFCIHANTLCRS